MRATSPVAVVTGEPGDRTGGVPPARPRGLCGGATLALLPLLRVARGRIVNVSSGGGSLADMGAGTPAYHVSKAGLNALTRTLAAELRSDGILVNAICPGWTATDMGGGAGWPVADGATSIVWGVTLLDGAGGRLLPRRRSLAW